jgi:hypothetical protein
MNMSANDKLRHSGCCMQGKLLLRLMCDDHLLVLCI